MNDPFNFYFVGCALRRETNSASRSGGGKEEGDEGSQVLGQVGAQEHRQILQHVARVPTSRYTHSNLEIQRGFEYQNLNNGPVVVRY